VLDFVYYPVSAILWFWHTVFGAVLDPASGYAWALSVVFLVCTLRALLFKPFMHQVRSMKKMQDFAPQIKALQQKYRDDPQRLTKEMQKLQAAHGINPITGCLPFLVQVPVFLGLYHVLNGFKPGAPSNFVFNAADVASFVDAGVFGAKLSNTISQPSAVLAAFGTDRTEMLLVGVPLMIAAAVATHFTARHSVARQATNPALAGDGSAPGPTTQAAMLNRLSIWVFPLFLLVGGPFLPLAILVYWLTNNFWTLAQQRLVYRRMDSEEANRVGSPTVLTESTADSPALKAGIVEAAATEQPGAGHDSREDRSHDVDNPGGTPR
jgi:YidC/Oxa1 family membrane protein insertase